MRNEEQRNEEGKTMLNIEYPMLTVEVKYPPADGQGGRRVVVYCLQLTA